MLENTTNPVEAIFLEALEQPVDQQQAFLQERCGGDTELLHQVTELLAAHEQTGSFFVDKQPAWQSTTRSKDRSAELSEHVGQTIGPYTLREQIGEGGMGIVYVAEQQRPIQRKVALKVIKPGMDSKAVLARFEAEQQALAMMNHRNIAKVLDAGIAESGRPYFVMELVAGIPITEYCDRKKLSIEQRLELFIQVCKAIQHAHQKGIIHRDIKPSNVLVTEEDGQAIPKVIDFGVAKALSQKLTDRTLYTNFQAFLGTPLYASPEQASLSNIDVDTRSDVYSLGVLLYELVTGSTPYNKEQLQKAAYEEMCRIICEQAAVRPSTRLSTMGDTATEISEHRRCDPSQLVRSVRGDLDWIVMKALEKDRSRRYEGASNLAADIGRLLKSEAIEARPPSMQYRVSRFVQRHRQWVAIAASSLALLLVAMATVSWLYLRTNDLLHQTQDLVIEKALTQACSGELKEVEATLSKYEQVFDDDRRPRTLMGIAMLHDGQNSEAISLMQQVLKDYPNDLAANAVLSIAFVHNGKWPEGAECGKRAKALASSGGLSEFEEFLYGYSCMYINPFEGARVLQRVTNKHPTWLMARALRAGALGHVAERSHNVEDADEARAEVEIVYKLLPNNALVEMLMVFSHNMSIHLYKSNSIDTTSLQHSAEDAVTKLADRSNYALGLAMVAQYYDAIGDDASSRQYWRLTGEQGSGFWTEFAIANHLAENSTQNTLRMLEELPNRQEWEVRLAEAYLLIDDRDRRQEAISFFDNTIRTSEDPFVWYKGIQILLLAGEAEKAHALTTKFLQENPGDAESIINELSALKIAASKTPPHLAGAEVGFQELYMAALWHIAHGERESAIHYLNLTEDFGDLSHYWSRAFRKRLVSDPSWPRGNLRINDAKARAK